MAPIAPTTLPPLRSLPDSSISEIAHHLRQLNELYWPSPPNLLQNLPIPRRRPGPLAKFKTNLPDSGYASMATSDVEDDPDEDAPNDPHSDSSDVGDELRADPFERAFAVKWITGLIGRIDELPDAAEDEDAREGLLDNASAILARFAHQEEVDEPDITRCFAFPVPDGPALQIELNDAALSSSDHTSVGLQSWGSAIIFGQRICADPAAFGLADGPLRILELGAGTGLLSIVAAKLLPRATVVATDYHPAILDNLAANVHTNYLDDRICVARLDWQYPSDGAPLDKTFQILLAADVVYHPDHARWLRNCATRLLHRDGTFHLIVPVRTSGRHEGVDRTIDEAFARDRATDADVCAGHRLAILQTIDLGRQGVVGRADESGYRLFKIGWVPS
ncbi:hypothetical protein MKEN_00044200 [Mycena kentingensis (nom. inval.)]|nr:hypothetical protein MKEN_00044200 [Mycena kentingensis (nom. inval.)]